MLFKLIKLPKFRGIWVFKNILLFSTIPYLTGLVEAYKNGDFDILAKIPAFVGGRSEISNMLREDIERISNTTLKF